MAQLALEIVKYSAPERGSLGTENIEREIKGTSRRYQTIDATSFIFYPKKERRRSRVRNNRGRCGNDNLGSWVKEKKWWEWTGH